jgi:hypothetical protein
MSYQRGSLKKVKRKEGETWVLRYRVKLADGRRVEHNAPVGLLAVLPKESDAWREVDGLDFPYASMTLQLPAVFHFTLLRSIT